MKRKKFYLMLMACLCGLTTHAYDIEMNGVYYNITDPTAKELAVTYVESGDGNADFYYGNINIPKRISKDGTTYTITSIGDNAFYCCSNLTSVSIPESVTSIGSCAFRSCAGLTSVIIPEGVTTIDVSAFYECSGLTSIIIPEGVTTIGRYAFYRCTSLISVSLPESVTSIGMYAFYGCNSLMTATIPESVTSIGKYAFGNVHYLKFLSSTPPTCDDGLPFSGTIIVPIGSKESYTAVGWGSVREENLEVGGLYFTILSEEEATAGVTRGYVISENNYVRNNRYSGEYIVPETIVYKGKTYTVTEICESTFQAASIDFYGDVEGLTGITLPQTLKRIGFQAFAQSDLRSIVIPKSVTEMGGLNTYNNVYMENPFSMCHQLTNIRVEEGNLVYDSRGNCNAIMKTATNELISSSLNTIIPSDTKSIGADAFAETPIESIVIPDGVEELKWGAFYCINESHIKSVVLPENLTAIGDNAFHSCRSLSSINIPNGVTSIGDGVFSGCDSLTSINIPEGVTSIGEKAFAYCKKISTVIIPDGVTSIGDGAFGVCYNLNSVTLPQSLTSIGDGAFARDSMLVSVVSKNQYPIEFGKDAFIVISDNCVLTIPKGTKSAYRAAGWTEDVFKGGIVEEIMYSTITPKGSKVARGGTAWLDIEMDNLQDIIAFQFELELPEGLSVATTSSGMLSASLTDRNNGQVLSSSILSNGNYQFVALSLASNGAFNGSEGTVVRIQVRADKDMEIGDYDITLKNVELTAQEGEDLNVISAVDNTSTLIVTDVLLGDVNGDGSISVTDAAYIVNHILQRTPSGFIADAADVNGDGSISVTDAARIVNIILSGGNGAKGIKRVADTLDPQ